MMFGQKSRSCFGGVIDYAIDYDGRNDKDVRILMAERVDVFYNEEGSLDADSRQVARSFQLQALMNPNVKKCVKHLWVSYRPEDLLVMINNAFKGKQYYISIENAEKELGKQRINDITDKAMRNDARCLLEKIGYSQTQYLIVRHSEKKNPHFHVVLNMVNNNGVRLNDFQEEKRGAKICRQITINNNYTWGDHKSISRVKKYHKHSDKVRAKICEEIYSISQSIHTAEALQNEARLKNLNVRYLTDYRTGHIVGISFAKDGFRFPAIKVDASLSAKNLFPSQITSKSPLSSLSTTEQDVVKRGGIVPGFNNQTLRPACAPGLPQSVKEYNTRHYYHKAIVNAMSNGNRAAYIMNIVGLALDSRCGIEDERAAAIASYMVDNNDNRSAEIGMVKELIRIANAQDGNQKNMFQRFWDFILNLMKASLNLKKLAIPYEKEHVRLKWSDIHEDTPGKTVGLACKIEEAVAQEYNKYKQNQERMLPKDAKYQKRTEKQDANVHHMKRNI